MVLNLSCTSDQLGEFSNHPIPDPPPQDSDDAISLGRTSVIACLESFPGDTNIQCWEKVT
jgi:hypothetical protein